MGDDELAETVYKCLKGRRYIIIMDDIRDVSAWDDIKICFPDDRIGSRILFTSRNMDVAMTASYGDSNYPLFSRPFGLHIRSLLGHLPDPSAFIFSSLKHLKVSDLSTIDMMSLYNLTGSEVLAFLRFLVVSSIPSSIEIFKNLEFLFMDNKKVLEIPAILSNMVKLRRVHFSGGAQLASSTS